MFKSFVSQGAYGALSPKHDVPNGGSDSCTRDVWCVRPAALGGRPPAKLFGLNLVNSTRAQTAHSLVAMAAAGQRATVQFVNAHCVNVMRDNALYRDVLARADFLLPDGSGIAMAARIAGVELGENLNGTDLFPELCRCAAAQRQSVYLLGAKPGIAQAAAAAMRARFPGLQIVGTRDGYWTCADEPDVIAAINASGAAILLVALGVPHQEIWIDRLRSQLSPCVALGVGGLFDYYSGAIPRAPRPFRVVGCEWMWRLMQEPQRLFTRYILGNPAFLAAATLHGWQMHRLRQRISLRTKRGFDYACAGLALIACLPILLLAGLAIKLEDGGPVFFRQTRIGARGKPFRIWKLRSMVRDAEVKLATLQAHSERDDTCFKMKCDPRVTRVGAVLRRLSLDELPQLLNILRGDMSVVGPRPALPREVAGYNTVARARLDGRPGLTCTWQVSGRADIPFDRQVALDVAYLASRSFMHDLSLILRTIPAVLCARGAY